MRFLKRSDSKEPDQPIEGWPSPESDVRPAPPAATPKQTGPVQSTKDGWALSVETVDDAKEAIADLKEKKRDHQALKKEVTAQQADVRAGHAEKRAGRFVMPRGRGKMGGIVRTTIRVNRRSDRIHMQNEIQAFNGQKAAIDRDIREIDAAIAKLQAFVRENAPAPKARTATQKPAPVADVTERLKASRI